MRSRRHGLRPLGARAQDGDEFLGLGLDNNNQDEETEERLIIWAELVRDEFAKN